GGVAVDGVVDLGSVQRQDRDRVVRRDENLVAHAVGTLATNSVTSCTRPRTSSARGSESNGCAVIAPGISRATSIPASVGWITSLPGITSTGHRIMSLVIPPTNGDVGGTPSSAAAIDSGSCRV